MQRLWARLVSPAAAGALPLGRSASHRGGATPAVLEPPASIAREELIATVRSFPYWYHRIYLGQGVYTLENDGAPAYHELVWERLRRALPDSLRGVRVLDVGCNAGYFSIQASLLGAARVVGVESWPDYLKQAEFCRRVWDLAIDYRPLEASDVGRLDEAFDLVVFTGILYHLKNPLQVLEDLGRLCRDAILVETEIIAERPGNTVYARSGPHGSARLTACHTGLMRFVERDDLEGDGSNWWVPDTECVRGMLRTAGFRYLSAPLYLAETRLVMVASKEPDSLLDRNALS